MSVLPRRAPPRIQIESTYDQLCDAGAMRILAAARDAIRARGRFTLALSGGMTPRGIYERLATAQLSSSADWAGWNFFWGDERWVPPQHPHSNYGMTCTALLDHVPVVPAQVYPMVPVGREPRVLARSQGDVLAHATKAARAYEATLAREIDACESSNDVFAGSGHRLPRFDLLLLGLGDDGHTASLFPGATAIEERSRWVVATPGPGGTVERALPRLTLTLPVLNAAREAVFLVSGAAKSSVVAAVLREAGSSLPGPHPQPLPAARVMLAQGQLTWLLDAEAASELSSEA